MPVSNTLPKDFIIVFYGVKQPSKLHLEAIISCSSKEQFEGILEAFIQFNLIFVCDNDTFIDVAPLLANHHNLKAVYVRTDQEDILWPVGLEERTFQSVKVNSENELTRRLYIEAMNCYYEQGVQYQQGGNHGLSELKLTLAQEALKNTQQFC